LKTERENKGGRYKVELRAYGSGNQKTENERTSRTDE